MRSERLSHSSTLVIRSRKKSDALREYFVEAQAWDRIYQGEIDIVYGPKGAGKSALYVLIQDKTDELFDRSVLLIFAENPRGAIAFQDLVLDPPTSEREFTAIWKPYFLTLLGRVLRDFGSANAHADRVCRLLEEHELLPKEGPSLAAIVRSVRDYVARIIGPNSVEGSMAVDPASGLPVAFTGRIQFQEPDMKSQEKGILSVDERLGMADSALEASGFVAWLLIDRLDVAFDESSEPEKNAIRALFRAYRDLRARSRIELKIFLRTDIWKRITEEVFAKLLTFRVTFISLGTSPASKT